LHPITLLWELSQYQETSQQLEFPIISGIELLDKGQTADDDPCRHNKGGGYRSIRVEPTSFLVLMKIDHFALLKTQTNTGKLRADDLRGATPAKVT
jgi:hypothetical protein